eukprot:gene22897-biopygen2787
MRLCRRGGDTGYWENRPRARPGRGPGRTPSRFCLKIHTFFRYIYLQGGTAEDASGTRPFLRFLSRRTRPGRARGRFSLCIPCPCIPCPCIPCPCIPCPHPHPPTQSHANDALSETLRTTRVSLPSRQNPPNQTANSHCCKQTHASASFPHQALPARRWRALAGGHSFGNNVLYFLVWCPYCPFWSHPPAEWTLPALPWALHSLVRAVRAAGAGNARGRGKGGRRREGRWGRRGLLVPRAMFPSWLCERLSCAPNVSTLVGFFQFPYNF